MTHQILLQHYYIIGFTLACTLCVILCPIFRVIALFFKIMDHPNLSIKSHASSTPYLGGAAIAIAFILSVRIMFFIANYHLISFYQWLLVGGVIIVILGLLDDIVIGGLSVNIKILGQLLASLCVLFSGLHISSIQPSWLSELITIIWLIGIMNAINIIDIMDGLAGSVVFICCIAFFYFSIEVSEKMLALSLAGAVLGFLPYNLSKNLKMFMGDTGSLFLGYLLAIFSLKIGFTHQTFYIPILILGIPIFDTLFVMIVRYQKGLSPFKGSKDHFAMRLRFKGFSHYQILYIASGTTLFFSICSWIMYQINFFYSTLLFLVLICIILMAGIWLAKIEEGI